MNEEAGDRFIVLTGDTVTRIANRPFVLDIIAKDCRPGDVVEIRLHQHDRTPTVLARSLLIGKNGRGRFYGWGPAGIFQLSIGMPKRRGTKAPVIRVSALSRTKLALLCYRSSPVVVRKAYRLLFQGSVKGFEYRLLRCFEGLNSPSYSEWLRAHTDEKRQPEENPGLNLEKEVPLVLISIMPGSRAQEGATRQSLGRQSHSHLKEIAFDKVSATMAGGGRTFWMRLPAGMILHETAVERLLQPLMDDPSVVASYCDEDAIDRHGRRSDPFFKPAWNPPLAETGWLAPDGAMIRLDALAGLSDPAVETSGNLLLTASRHGDIAHVPRVLLHRNILRKPAQPSTKRVPQAKTKVSVVIPTRDRADLLQICLDGLFNRTRADDLQIIVVDNDSREEETERLFQRHAADERFMRLPVPGEFNFSRLCNAGVAVAKHELVLLLNNDIDPIHPEWLDQMVAELDDFRVGIAGAFLLFPDGSAQHAGVTLGVGSVARHNFHFRVPNAKEDLGLMEQRQETSAVTAACLLTRKSLWQSLNGMDESHLPVAFNDIDYCLRVREAGRAIIWTPHARLVHHESVSRGPDDTSAKYARFVEEERYMYERWGHVMERDPFYNPNLSLVAGDHKLDVMPRELSARMPDLPRRLVSNKAVS